MNWRDSIYSDGSGNYVHPDEVVYGDQVTIRLRVLKNDDLLGVKLRRVKNGSEHQDKMICLKGPGPFDYYEVTFKVNQPVISYHFYLHTKKEVLFYNQYGWTHDLPTEDHDFKLIAGYKAPRWVRHSVFYQIFPDRFCNGNPDLDVRDGEYDFDGHTTTHMDWEQAPKEYQDVFCLDFYGGDLPGVESKIPYLEELGVNALYINPIFQSATSHRYDCLDYFKVDPHLGGDQALSSLTSSLHKAKMKVILDVSINHTGTAHKWFNKENAFFPSTIGAYQNPDSRERHYYFFDEEGDYHKWYGVDTLPTLNYTSKELRGILYESEHGMVKHWLRPPFEIDGWRFDVANDMARKDGLDLSHEVWEGITKSIKEVNPSAYVLAEEWLDCSEYLQGFKWDSAMNYFGCARPVRQYVGDGDLFLGRDPDFKSIDMPLTGDQFKKRVLQHLAKLPYATAANQFNLLGSHDTHRLHNNPKIKFSAYEVAVMWMFLLPGAPNIYYGDEVGIDGRIETVEGCRYPMPWNEKKWKMNYRHLYKTLSHLKRDNPCFHDGGFKFLMTQGYGVAAARFLEGEAYILMASMDQEEKTYDIPAYVLGADETWQAKVILGYDQKVSLKDGMIRVTLPPKSGVLINLDSTFNKKDPKAKEIS